MYNKSPNFGPKDFSDSENEVRVFTRLNHALGIAYRTFTHCVIVRYTPYLYVKNVQKTIFSKDKQRSLQPVGHPLLAYWSLDYSMPTYTLSRRRLSL